MRGGGFPFNNLYFAVHAGYPATELGAVDYLYPHACGFAVGIYYNVPFEPVSEMVVQRVHHLPFVDLKRYPF